MGPVPTSLRLGSGPAVSLLSLEAAPPCPGSPRCKQAALISDGESSPGAARLPDAPRTEAGAQQAAGAARHPPSPGQQLRLPQMGRGNARPGCIPHTCRWLCWGGGGTQGCGVTPPMGATCTTRLRARTSRLRSSERHVGTQPQAQGGGGKAFKLILLQPHGGPGGCGHIPDPGSARGAGPVPSPQLGCSRESARLGAVGLGTPGDGHSDHGGPGGTRGCAEPPPHECLSSPAPLQEC